MQDKIRFTVNGQAVEESSVPPSTTLLNYLRQNLGLTGTKEGCAEGDCGACTVAIIDPDAPSGPAYRAVNSCLVLLPMVQNKTIVTVEGLKQGGAYHPVQECLVKELGSQCGYCTPGVIMSMFAAHYRQDLKEQWQLDDQMCGNLCRCTGYRPIMDAARATAAKATPDAFTAALAAAERGSMELSYTHDSGQRHFTPASFEDLWDILDANDDARFVVGGTDLSLEITKAFEIPPCLVSLEGLGALARLERAEEHWWVGAGAPLSLVESTLSEDFSALERMLRFFGARQIKNRATVGGNICTASPIGDMPPVLIALEAVAVLRSRAGRREMPLEDFFVGYRQTALARGEILEAVKIPLPAEGDVRSAAYKVSKRQELDISTVSAGMVVKIDAQGVVTSARLAYGGMAATPARASKAEAALVGRAWTQSCVEAAAEAMSEDFTPMDDHRGSAWYRATVAANLLRGFFLETQGDPSPRLPYRPTGTVNLEVGQ